MYTAVPIYKQTSTQKINTSVLHKYLYEKNNCTYYSLGELNLK